MTDRCVVLLAHTLAPPVLARHEALAIALAPRFDVVLLLTEPLDPPFGIGDVEILRPAEIFRPELGAKAASGRIVPGNVDLALLALHRRRPGYAHLWLIEYDVLFLDGPALLAQLDAASQADLIVAARHQTRDASPAWHWWPTLSRTPLPGPARRGARRAMLCVARYGAALLAQLEAAYRAGWAGHFEAVVPTLAWEAGLRVETLNEVARRAIGRTLVTYESFAFRDCRFSPEALIYHPVKTAAAEAAIRAARRAAGDNEG